MTHYAVVVAFEYNDDPNDPQRPLIIRDVIDAFATTLQQDAFAGARLHHVTLHKDNRPSRTPFAPWIEIQDNPPERLPYVCEETARPGCPARHHHRLYSRTMTGHVNVHCPSPYTAPDHDHDLEWQMEHA